MDPVKEGEESGDDDEDGDSNRDVKKQSLSLKSDKSVDKAVKSVPDGVENVPSMFPQPACVPQALQPDLAGAGDLLLQAQAGDGQEG